MTISDDIIYGRQALQKGEPWIVPDAFEYLKSVVHPDWSVFEWGAGGSTVWFARNCRMIISVEHNPFWYDDIRGKLIREDLLYTKAVIWLVVGGPEEQFKPYADAILNYPDVLFDIVFVDGEVSAREWCVANALDKIKPGGWLLLDNSDWYKDGCEKLDEWERTDFIAKGLKWVGQPGTFDLWTSFFHKPGGK